MGMKALYTSKLGFALPAASPRAIAYTANSPSSRNQETRFVPDAILLHSSNACVTPPRQRQDDMTRKPSAHRRADYPHFHILQTRWMDNDVYGHVNNVVYYSWFDTAVNHFLMAKQALDIPRGDIIGLVIETRCNYFAPLAFPQNIEAGIRVARLGGSSVRYEVGLFAEGDELCAAKGHFVHVYVDRETRRPVPVPEPLRAVLTGLQR